MTYPHIGTELSTTEECLNVAANLVTSLKERAAYTEELRRIPEENVKDLLSSGLHRLAVPERFGGLDIGYDVMLDVATELARGCPATAWCYCLWSAHSWLVGYWPLEAQQEVFSDGPDALCSSSLRAGIAQFEPVGGGFRLSGHWEFSSGCDSASWLILGGQAPEGWRWALVPRSDYKIIDTWYVTGLRGTGSKDIEVKDAYIPAHRILDRETAGDGDWTGWKIHQHHLYHMPIAPLLGWDLVSPIVGMAQGTIDEFTSLISGTSGSGRSAESPVIQLRLSEASASVDAAIALMRSDIGQILDTAKKGEPFSPLDRARYQRDRAFVTKLSLDAVNRIFEVSGGHSLFTTGTLQRFHRDANAAAHRDGLIMDLGGQQFGKLALGLNPES